MTETSELHHACSAERTDQVTYRRDQAHVGVSNYGQRSHIVFPFLPAVLQRRIHRTLSAGPQGRFEEGARWTVGRGPRIGFKSESNRVAKMLCSEGIRLDPRGGQVRMEIRVQRETNVDAGCFGSSKAGLPTIHQEVRATQITTVAVARALGCATRSAKTQVYGCVEV